MYLIEDGSLSKYLATLPNGAKGFLDCKVTAILYRRMLGEMPDLKKALDSDAFFFIQQRLPMKDASFIPITLHVASVLAFAQRKAWDSVSMRQKLKQYGREILSTPNYRRLFAILSPTFVTMGAGLRYANDFKGVKAAGKPLTKTSAQMTIVNPAHLYPPFYVDAYNGIFEASLEAASARNVTSLIEQISETGSVSRFTWDG